MKAKNRKLITATRKELEYELKLKEGQLPDDWYGHVFINSPAGTVNSNGLPYPEGSKEQGSPIMNGDGYVFRFDLQPDKVKVKTALMKPPCYYADEATKEGNSNGYNSLYAFNNCGMSRLSLALGARNELNTAISPIKFKGDEYPRMIACYDAGKPWEFNPLSLEMMTAIGNNSEYVYATPEKLFPFPVIQTTAHPVFDPRTQELFLVNFYHSLHQNNAYESALKILEKDVHKAEDFLEDLVKNSWHKLKHTHIIKEIDHLLGIHSDTEDHKHHSLKWLKNMIHIHHQDTLDDTAKDSNDVFVLRHTGKSGQLEKWQVLDENHQPIDIEQCMHQVAFTKDYLILADATFKVSLDLMFNNPFKSKALNAWLRVLLTKKQLPNLELYLIKRSDLDPQSKTVIAQALPQPIPLEAVHFSANYVNPGGKITLHLAHNSAACLAEWVRNFDHLAYAPHKSVDPEVIGLISVGCMDIGRIGKVVIDANSGDLISEDYIIEKGNTADIDKIGVHTWGVGLYTYRGIIEAGEIPDSIEYNYWSSYGLDPRLHTKFIFDLYYNYQNRIIKQDEMLRLNKEGIPFVLSRQNVNSMQLEDFYQFSKEVILKSVQFVPRKASAAPITDHQQKDGYIFTSVLVNYPKDNQDNYQCEIWIFKAWDLSSGPVCTLHHPDLDYAFTLHSVWVDKIGSNTDNPYYIDPREDYDPLIKNLYIKERRKEVQELFDKHVYPNFPKP
ncbi:MAG: hypothetical protein EA362_14205 [Saprospirales bacterium]|nr:MAG: hypothetical protein EA362_14205 [Saprospirales bacterium]